MAKPKNSEAVPGDAGPKRPAEAGTASAARSGPGATLSSGAGTTESTGAVLAQARSVRSREQILGATIECLLTNGYAATTTQRVQELAGVSRGRLLYHFPNKRELIAAAVAHAADLRLNAASSAGDRPAAAPGRPDAAETERRITTAVDELWASHSEPIFWVAVESWNAARTDPELAELTREHERTVMRRVRQSIQHNLGPELADLPGIDAIMDIVFTSMRGVAMTYMFSGRPMATEPMLATWKQLLADHISTQSRSITRK